MSTPPTPDDWALATAMGVRRITGNDLQEQHDVLQALQRPPPATAPTPDVSALATAMGVRRITGNDLQEQHDFLQSLQRHPPTDDHLDDHLVLALSDSDASANDEQAEAGVEVQPDGGAGGGAGGGAEGGDDPKIGQEYPTERDAIESIKLWCKNKGYTAWSVKRMVHCSYSHKPKPSGKSTDPDGLLKKRHRTSKGNPPEGYPENLCTFKVNLSTDTKTGRCSIRKMTDHNHPPAAVLKPTQRVWTAEQQDVLKMYAMTNVTVASAVLLMQAQYPTEQWKAQDIRNVFRKYGGRTATDSADVVTELMELRRQDPRWFVDYRVDKETHQLTHLFWASPRQQELAQKLHYVLIHDNTYGCNVYALSLGLFASVNYCGRTVMLAQCLVNREDTAAYEWAYTCWLKCVGRAPHVVFTDADKAVQGAVPKVFPDSAHFWCLWHIAKNLLKNCLTKDAKSWPAFRSEFYAVQRQTDKDIFHSMWKAVLDKYPAYKSYLQQELGHVERWGMPWQVCVFTAGMSATSRSEGLNKNAKKFLSKRSTLQKVVRELRRREDREQEIFEEDSQQLDLHKTYKAQYTQAKELVHDAVAELEGKVGTFPMQLVVRQIAMSVNYCCQLQTSADPEPELDCDTDEDFGYGDEGRDLSPGRLETVKTWAKKYPGTPIWKVTRLSTAKSGKKAPAQFICAYDFKTPGGYPYAYHCTCGYGVRYGSPCRHFWTIYTRGSGFSFHMGLIHPNWFKNSPATAYPMVPGAQAADRAPPQTVYPEWPRPLLTNAGPVEDIVTDVTPLGETRRYGQLLGASKALIDTALQLDRYQEVLEGLSALRLQIQQPRLPAIVNPAPGRHKGDRTTGNKRPRTSSTPQSKSTQDPLQDPELADLVQQLAQAPQPQPALQQLTQQVPQPPVLQPQALQPQPAQLPQQPWLPQQMALQPQPFPPLLPQMTQQMAQQMAQQTNFGWIPQYPQ